MAIKPSQHYPKTFGIIQVPWREMPMDNARPSTDRSYVEIITDNQRKLVEVMPAANSMMQVEPRILARHEQIAARIFNKWWTDRYCHHNGNTSGKGVRRMMAHIRIRSNSLIISAITPEDLERSFVIKTVKANIGRMNPNKVARLIRRKMKG